MHLILVNSKFSIPNNLIRWFPHLKIYYLIFVFTGSMQNHTYIEWRAVKAIYTRNKATLFN